MKNIKPILVIFLVFSSVHLAFSVPLVKAVEDSWETMASMPTARSGFGVAVIDGKIYAIGGYRGGPLSSNEEYDPVTNAWTTKTNMPTARGSFGIAVWQNRIYAIGGKTNNGLTSVNEVYDPATDTWENKRSMSTPRFGVVTNIVGGKIYVIGGAPGVKSDFIKMNEVYDPSTDTWATETPMTHSDFLYDSVVVDRKIYVVGTLTQIYDPETDTWSLGAPPPIPVHGAVGATTGLWAAKRIYLLGGTLDGTTTNINQVYNPDDNIWAVKEPMPHDRTNLAIAVVNDTLYALGGYRIVSQVTPTPPYDVAFNEHYFPVEYIPEFPSWTPLLIMLFAVMAVAVVYRHNMKKQGQGRF